jgi:hypothetical protein
VLFSNRMTYRPQVSFTLYSKCLEINPDCGGPEQVRFEERHNFTFSFKSCFVMQEACSCDRAAGRSMCKNYEQVLDEFCSETISTSVLTTTCLPEKRESVSCSFLLPCIFSPESDLAMCSSTAQRAVRGMPGQRLRLLPSLQGDLHAAGAL